MNIGRSRLQLEAAEDDIPSLQNAAKSFCQRLHKELGVLARFYLNQELGPCLAIVCLGENPDKIAFKLQKVAPFCEASGFSRVAEEEHVVEIFEDGLED